MDKNNISLLLTFVILFVLSYSSCSKKENTPTPLTHSKVKKKYDEDFHVFFIINKDTFISGSDRKKSIKLKKTKNGSRYLFVYTGDITDNKILSMGFPKKIDTNVTKSFHIDDAFSKLDFTYHNDTTTYISTGKKTDSLYIKEVDSSLNFIRGTFYLNVENLKSKEPYEVQEGSFAFFYE